MMLGIICEQTIRLEELAEVLQSITVHGDERIDIKGIAYDSKQIHAGMLFVAIDGEQCDGNEFIDEAIGRGAVAIVSEHLEIGRKDVVHIHVNSARQALAEIACSFYGNPSDKLEMVGITGTNGKTTTAYMVRAILEYTGRKSGLISTVSYDVGNRSIPASRTTPESLDLQSMLDNMVRADCKSAVMEVSSHALVQKRVWGVDFDVGVFTNLTQEHLDYHDSMEDYFSSKALLFRGLGQMSKSSTAVINLDDRWGLRLANTGGSWAHEITFGEHPSAMVCAEEVECGENGSRFRVRSPWGYADMEMKILGRFNVSNALAAIATCGALGIGVRDIQMALASFKAPPGRLEEIENDRGIRIFVDYAHTHAALRSVLKTLREVTNGRIITVFGCGGDRDHTKRARMGAVAERYSTFSVITTDNPRKEDPMEIIRQIQSGYESADDYEVVEDREDAIASALQRAQPGDFVLIAGKGHENYQQFADTTIPFDDREVAREVLADCCLLSR